MTSYSIKQFLFEPQEVKPLAILRVGMALLLLFQVFDISPQASLLLGSSSLLAHDLTQNPLDFPLDLPSWIAWGLRFGSSENTAISILGVIYILSLLSMGLGWKTRIGVFIAWITHFMFMNGSPLSYGTDFFAHVVLFLLIWMPSGNVMSLDSLSNKHSEIASASARLSLRVLQIYLCITYLASGLEKALGYQWWNGEAIWRSLMLPSLASFDFSGLAYYPWILKLAGWSTLLIECGYCFFIWPKHTRSFWLASTIGLHLAIAVFMRLWLFSFTMILLNICAFGFNTYAWQPTRQIRRALNRLRELKASRLTTSPVTLPSNRIVRFVNLQNGWASETLLFPVALVALLSLVIVFIYNLSSQQSKPFMKTTPDSPPIQPPSANLPLSHPKTANSTTPGAESISKALTSQLSKTLVSRTDNGSLRISQEVKEARSHLERGQRPLAIETLEAAIRKNESDEFARLDLAFLLGNTAPERERAIELFQSVLELNPENYIALGELLNRYSSDGKHREATELLDELSRKRPHSAHIAAQQGAYHLEQGRLSEAIEKFTQATQDPATRELSLTGLAEAYTQSGNYTKAAETYQKLVSALSERSRHPTNSVRTQKALQEAVFGSELAVTQALIFDKNFNDAERLLERLSQSKPNHPGVSELKRLLQRTRGEG